VREHVNDIASHLVKKDVAKSATVEARVTFALGHYHLDLQGHSVSYFPLVPPFVPQLNSAPGSHVTSLRIRVFPPRSPRAKAHAPGWAAPLAALDPAGPSVPSWLGKASRLKPFGNEVVSLGETTASRN
jgi:hypothetical protein